MSQTFHGIIRGSIIELQTDPGLGDGQHVAVVLQPCAPPTPDVPATVGKITTAAGMMSQHYSEQDDAILAEIDRERKSAHWREVDE